MADNDELAFELADAGFTANLMDALSLSADSTRVQFTDSNTEIEAGTEIEVGDASFTFADAIAADVQRFQIVGAELTAGDYVELAGNLDVVSTDDELTLDDGSTVNVRSVYLGASGVNGFAGFNAGTSEAIGFRLNNLNLGVALVSELTGGREWLSLKGEVESAGLTGVDAITLEGRALELQLHQPPATGRCWICLKRRCGLRPVGHPWCWITALIRVN